MNLQQNTLTMSGALTLGSVGVASVALTTAILPAQTLLVLGAGGGMLYAGCRMADGKSVNPFNKSDDKSADAPASA